MVKRKFVQFASALAYNPYIEGFFGGGIWKGKSKSFCVPGLNCYSCPGALYSCPLGTLQVGIGSVTSKIPAYVTGLLLLFGLALGRTVCGWLCPFGLIQELLYLIPSRKHQKNYFTRKFSSLKYVILVVFVFALPLFYLFYQGVAVPAFCKFICPAGTLQAGFPLIAQNEGLRTGLGLLFGWKTALCVFILLFCVYMFRAFCRFLCPLGAIYSLFNKVSYCGVAVYKSSCSNCGSCSRNCKMDVLLAGDRECISCGDCIKCCPEHAIYRKPYRGSR